MSIQSCIYDLNRKSSKMQSIGPNLPKKAETLRAGGWSPFTTKELLTATAVVAGCVVVWLQAGWGATKYSRKNNCVPWPTCRRGHAHVVCIVQSLRSPPIIPA